MAYLGSSLRNAHVMTPQDLAELLATGSERYDVEYKNPGSRDDKAFFSGVARAVLAMANRRDGGVVVVGVNEQRGSAATLLGLTAPQLATWNHDNVRDALAVYAEPSVDVDVHHVTLDGKTAVVIRVREFADIPVLCRKDGEKVREGALYVRSRRKAESVEVPRQAEMRDLIELATEKRLRAFFQTASAAGIRLGGPAGVTATPLLVTDAAQYQRELDAMMLAASEKARHRGFWRVSIHPQRYVPNRVPNIMALTPIMRAAAVQYRGWPYPSVLARKEAVIGTDWIEVEIDERIHVEHWRFHQSGHFTQVMGFWEDWYEQDVLTRPNEMPVANETFGVDFAVGTLTEIFEFASRLAASEAGADAMVIHIAAHRLKGRRLTLPPNRAPFLSPYVANIESFEFPPVTVERDALLSDPRRPAVDAAGEVLKRFGWDAGSQMLASFQPPLRNA